MSEVTLELYKAEERNVRTIEGRRGLWVHGIVTVMPAAPIERSAEQHLHAAWSWLAG